MHVLIIHIYIYIYIYTYIIYIYYIYMYIFTYTMSCTYCTKIEFLRRFYNKVLLKAYTLWGKKNYHSLCQLPLQRNSDLPSATVGFLILPSTTTNLHIIHKMFTLTYPSVSLYIYLYVCVLCVCCVSVCMCINDISV